MKKVTLTYPVGFGGLEEEAVKLTLMLYFTQQRGNVLEVFLSKGPPLETIFTPEVIQNYQDSGVIVEVE